MLTAATKSTPPAKPAPEKQPGMPFGKDDPKRQKKLLIGGIGGAALVIALVLLFVFRPWKTTAPPRLNEEPFKLAQLAATPEFNTLPFERREVYMKILDTKKPQVVQAYASGKLSDLEYQKALEAAHLGDRLDDMRKYYAKAPGSARTAYLDKMLAKKEVKEGASKNNPVAKEEKKEQDLLKDETSRKAQVNTWPTEVREQFEQFEKALADRKKVHKDAKAAVKEAKNPATNAVGSAATKPVE